MQDVNLLPEKNKKDFTYAILRRVILFFTTWIAGLGIIFGVLLFPAYFFITFQQREVERAKTVEEDLQRAAKISEVEEQVRHVNTLAGVVNDRELEKSGVAGLISVLFNQAPSGAFVTSVVYMPQTEEVRITGVAQNRALLLRYIDIVRSTPELTEVSSPVANIIKEENIDFVLTARFSI